MKMQNFIHKKDNKVFQYAITARKKPQRITKIKASIDKY